jgi:transcriptional regulator with XRE-family HTH domain
MNMILTPFELETILGENIKALRLQKNIDRKTLCAHAGISENALRHLEGGNGTTLKTFIRVLKALDRESWLTSLAPEVSINPLHMIKEKRTRQRASRKKHDKKENV